MALIQTARRVAFGELALKDIPKRQRRAVERVIAAVPKQQLAGFTTEKRSGSSATRGPTIPRASRFRNARTS